MTKFCDTRWSLYRDYVHENALASQRKPNTRQIAFTALVDHQQTCPQCKRHLSAVMLLGRAVEHVEASDAAL